MNTLLLLRLHKFRLYAAGLTLLSVFLALGVYGDGGGSFGRWLAAGATHWVGVFRVLLPPLGLAIACVFLIKQERPRFSQHWKGVPVLLLSSVALYGAICLRITHTLTGSTSAGRLGQILSTPAQSWLGFVGFVLAAAMGLAIGGALVTLTPLGTMLDAVINGVTAAVCATGRGLRRVYEHLTSLSSDSVDVRKESAVYDWALEDAADLSTPAKAKKKRTKLPDNLYDSHALPAPGDRVRGQWTLPPLSTLKKSVAQKTDEVEALARGQKLAETLQIHNVDVTLTGMVVGPTVTRYELTLAEGVKVAKVKAARDDIALAMGTSEVRILSHIPGKSAMGIEVPNVTRATVTLGDMLTSFEGLHCSSPLDIPVGKDISGQNMFVNLASSRHLLIAGTTGSGKSVGLNGIVTSLLLRATPDEVRFILVDPKQVEMGQFKGLPHLLTEPITDVHNAQKALEWAVEEMERRYSILAEAGFRDIQGFNAAIAAGELDDGEAKSMFYILVILDELADLMMTSAKETETAIVRIAQKARAVGIHLVVSTQKPVVSIISTLIRSNLPTRIAYSTATATDSRVILDEPGAERLIGKGDLLLQTETAREPIRLQGPWVSEEEIRKIVAFWKKQKKVAPIQLAQDSVVVSEVPIVTGQSLNLRMAAELVVFSQLASPQMLQRKMKIDADAAELMLTMLEEQGVVSEEINGRRSVLVSPEEFSAPSSFVSV